MTGWLFKELRQNRGAFIAAILIPAVTVWFPVYMGAASATQEHWVWREGFETVANVPSLTLCLMLFGYVIFSIIIQGIFLGDEKKKWGYFTASLPDGRCRSVYMKYVLAFMLCGVYLIAVFFADISVQTVSYMVFGIEQQSVFGIACIFFFMQLLLRALDFPCIVRWGTMFGVKVKAYAVCALVIAACIWLLFGPLPESADAFFAGIGKFIQDFREGRYGREMMLAVSLLPPAALILYYFSYRLSCRLYMKGVEGYEK